MPSSLHTIALISTLSIAAIAIGCAEPGINELAVQTDANPSPDATRDTPNILINPNNGTVADAPPMGNDPTTNIPTDVADDPPPDTPDVPLDIPPDEPDVPPEPTFCMDLTEGNAGRWGSGGEEAPTTVIMDDPDRQQVGETALRATTDAAFDWFLVYPKDRDVTWDLERFEAITFWFYGENPNAFGWQGENPWFVLEDTSGAQMTLRPVVNVLTEDTWTLYEVPLAGGDGWRRQGDADLTRIRAVELHTDTWDTGFTVWIDAFGFKRPDGAPCVDDCGAACPSARCIDDRGMPSCLP